MPLGRSSRMIAKPPEKKGVGLGISTCTSLQDPGAKHTAGFGQIFPEKVDLLWDHIPEFLSQCQGWGLGWDAPTARVRISTISPGVLRWRD